MMVIGDCNREAAHRTRNRSSKCFGRCYRALASSEADVSQAVAGSLLGRRSIIANLWRDLFSNPSQWWDNRAEKVNPRYPDFKHKTTEQSLWLDSKLNPPWVEKELSGFRPESLQVDLFTWNRRLARSVEAQQYEKTMQLFQQMQQEGMFPGKLAFIPVLKACSHLGDLQEGRRIHEEIVRYGHESDVYVSNCLVKMYAKCGSIGDASKVFSKMPTRNVVSWNTMIQGYVKCGDGQSGLELFRQMQQEGMEPDPVTFVAVLNACAGVAALEEGRLIHEQIIRSGYLGDVFVSSSLVDMYAKCGSIENAWRVFEKIPKSNVVAWSAMILGFVGCGEGQKALNVYRQMRREGVEPNRVTFIGVLNACVKLSALEEGRCVHEEIIQSGLEYDVFVASSLVDMYANCSSVEDAWTVFQKIPKPDVVAWSSIILAYVKSGNGNKALELFHQMQREGTKPDPVTLVGVLKACASIAALEEGRLVHEQIIRGHCESNSFLASGLVDMYAKCGSVEEARTVFENIPTRDVVAWTSMLGAYALHGHGNEALGHFQRMYQEGVNVDVVTFVSVLSACGHAGLVDEGLSYFESMGAVYNVCPAGCHHVCIVDLLGRAGHLHEAEDWIKTMSCEPDHTVWMSLLGACRVHGNVEMGEITANRVAETDPENTSGSQ